jgi:hypothetical protein
MLVVLMQRIRWKMNMTSTRLAHTSISLSTCYVSINLVNTKGKNFPNLDMQVATSSNSLVYLCSCLFSFLLMVSPISMCEENQTYIQLYGRRGRRWIDRRTFSFSYALPRICIVKKTYLSSCLSLLHCIKIMIESHNDVYICP